MGEEMCTATMISPDYTELEANWSGMELLNVFELVHCGTEFEPLGEHLIIDLTFDLFQKSVHPLYLYQTFAKLETVLDMMRYTKSRLVLIRNYPFSTDFHRFEISLKILDAYTDLLIQYYNASVIYMPHLISRYSLKKIKNPVISLINAARLGKNCRVPIENSSRLSVLYSVDFLHVLIEHLESGITDNLIVEGIEMNLQSISQIAQSVVGRAPIQFDRGHFYHNHYPDTKATAVNHINYMLENMMIDLIDRLF